MASVHHSWWVLEANTQSIIVWHASWSWYWNASETEKFCTVTNNSNGQYSVTFLNSHPEWANYPVTFGAEEDGNRDVPKISIVRWTKTSNWFDFIVTIDDNWQWADTPNDAGRSFNALKTVEVVVV